MSVCPHTPENFSTKLVNNILQNFNFLKKFKNRFSPFKLAEKIIEIVQNDPYTVILVAKALYKILHQIPNLFFLLEVWTPVLRVFFEFVALYFINFILLVGKDKKVYFKDEKTKSEEEECQF